MLMNVMIIFSPTHTITDHIDFWGDRYQLNCF